MYDFTFKTELCINYANFSLVLVICITYFNKVLTAARMHTTYFNSNEDFFFKSKNFDDRIVAKVLHVMHFERCAK